jgi:hypothetical protein
MDTHFVTVEDLKHFKSDLLKEIKNLLAKTNAVNPPQRKWLKSHEVRRILTISPGTLLNLRMNGLLPFTRIGGVIYYKYDDIQQMLERNKRCGG